MHSKLCLFSPKQDTLEIDALNAFYKNKAPNERVLVIVGGGTAAFTYLYTVEIDPQYKHILILGNQGYWSHAAHRLSQPHHILALPHELSDKFVDPAQHDEENGILPHFPNSAYAHSKDYQKKLVDLEKATIEKLHKSGITVLLLRKVAVTTVDRFNSSSFVLGLHQPNIQVIGHKIIMATGAGPARKLPPSIAPTKPAATVVQTQGSMPLSYLNERILNYNDILTSTAEKCRNKEVLIYGGGATAAWAMEIAALTAKPVAWIAKSGFDEAVNAGPRVYAIIKRTQPLQLQGKIDSIRYTTCEITGEQKLLIHISAINNKGSVVQSKCYTVDYLINCIGQEPYELEGLPNIISSSLQNELAPLLDKNYVAGNEQCMLGWSNKQGDFMIIGSAAGTYYNRNNPTNQQIPSVSKLLPRSGQVPVTIGGVVSSVSALTNYMPVSQNLKTGKSTLLSMNVNIMNATQLAVYFTTRYPDAPAKKINDAVVAFINQRSKTEFGISPKQVSEFLDKHLKGFSKESPTYFIQSKL